MASPRVLFPYIPVHQAFVPVWYLLMMTLAGHTARSGDHLPHPDPQP
jgi:hypothetical protein